MGFPVYAMSNAMDKLKGRPVVFGEVLFDRFPDGTDVLGGAPFNVAWHLQGFGGSPLLLSRVGDDEAGRLVRESMQQWGMDTAGLQTHPHRPTGAVDIRMGDAGHSFEILPDQAYDDIDARSLVAGVMSGLQAALFYHGSLVVRTPTGRVALDALLARNDSPVFVDVNLRTPWWHADVIASLMQGARWAKVNDEELGILSTYRGESLEETARRFKSEHDLALLVVTRGADGASFFDDSGRTIEIAPEPGGPIVDTVGAGDAFTSVTLLGLLLGWSPAVTIARAQRFASRVCRQRGATSTDDTLYRETMAEWDARTP